MYKSELRQKLLKYRNNLTSTPPLFKQCILMSSSFLYQDVWKQNERTPGMPLVLSLRSHMGSNIYKQNFSNPISFLYHAFATNCSVLIAKTHNANILYYQIIQKSTFLFHSKDFICFISCWILSTHFYAYRCILSYILLRPNTKQRYRRY